MLDRETNETVASTDLPADAFQDRFIVVLIGTTQSRNVGAVARAMMNLGFRHLRLVAPVGYSRDLAGVPARQAEAILDTLTTYPTLDDALADCETSVGFSERGGTSPARFLTLPGWAASLARTGGETEEALPPRTALVFGPEDNGLSAEDRSRCARMVRIPSTDEFASYNLAQSVLLTLYEISRYLPELSSPAPTTVARATGNDYVQLDRILEDLLNESGFVRTGSPAPVPATLRALLRRLDADPHEMSLLLALFSRLRTTLRRGKQTVS